MNKCSILDIPENILDDDQSNRQSRSKTAKSKYLTNQRNQLESDFTLNALVNETPNTLGIAMEELRHWIKEAIIPKDVLKSILTTAKHYQLNPLLGQIDWELNEENHWEIYIPIDGWISLIHQQPTFQGIAFDQSPETEDGIPIWMECTIYRSDLTHPITVREYYAELKTDHPVWQQMPRRMLRHKTLQQCARLAFGIAVPESKAPIPSKNITKSSFIKTSVSINHKALLKEKLNMNKFRA